MTFTNNLSEEESLAAYNRCAVPGPDHVLYEEFSERTHYTLGQDGWEEVADYGLEGAVKHVSGEARSGASG